MILKLKHPPSLIRLIFIQANVVQIQYIVVTLPVDTVRDTVICLEKSNQPILYIIAKRQCSCFHKSNKSEIIVFAIGKLDYVHFLMRHVRHNINVNLCSFTQSLMIINDGLSSYV